MELLIVIAITDTLILAGIVSLHVVILKRVKLLDKIIDLVGKFRKPPELF